MVTLLDLVTEMFRKRRIVGQLEMVFRVFPALGFLDPPDIGKDVDTQTNQHQQARQEQAMCTPRPEGSGARHEDWPWVHVAWESYAVNLGTLPPV